MTKKYMLLILAICFLLGCAKEKEIYENHNISLYPNPTDGPVSFYISLNNENIHTLKIINIANGELVADLQDLNISRYDIRYDLSDFKEGAYLFEVQVNDRIIEKLEVVKVDQ